MNQARTVHAAYQSRAIKRAESPLAHALRVLSADGVAVYPVFVDITGSLNAALMLAQTLYWTRTYLLDHPDRQGWLRKSRQEWIKETGLTRTEQETARRHLRGYDFWQEAERGMPATLHFRIDLDKLAQRINQQIEPGSIDWRDGVALRALLGRPLLLRRRLTEWTQSTNATWLLSYFMQRASMMLASGIEQTQFNVSMATLASDTHLSRKELETARRELRETGFLQEHRKKRQPPYNRIEYRLNFDSLSALLGDEPAIKPATKTRANYSDRRPDVRKLASASHGTKKYDNQIVPARDNKTIGENPANRVSTGPEQGIRSQQLGVSAVKTALDSLNFDLFSDTHTSEPCQLIGENPANKMAESSPSSWQGSGGVIRNVNKTTKTLTTTPTTARSYQRRPQDPILPTVAARVGSAWIWPDCFAIDAVRQNVTTLLEPVVSQAQALLDELSANMRQGNIRNAYAYLYQLVQKAKDGCFVPVKGIHEAEFRKQAAARSAALEEANRRHQQQVAAATDAPHPLADKLRQLQEQQRLRQRQTHGGGSH